MSLDLPTRLDLFAIGRDYVVTRATKIDPAQVDTQGSDVNIFVGSTSVVGSAIVRQIAYGVSSLLLDGAEDEDLDRYAWDRYQLTRKGASAAVGYVRLYRPAPGPGGSVDAGSKLTTLNSVEYITVETAQFDPSTLSVTVKVRAVLAGKLSQVGRNQIRRVSAFDPSIQVNNDDPTAHGEDREEDDVFRERIRDFWRTARRGILAAIEFGARTVPGIVSAQAVEALSGLNQPARVVVLYIADSSGVASQAIAQAVTEALVEYRAAGIAVIVVTSMPQIVDIALRLAFLSGVDTTALAENIRGAVVEFVNSLPVNGTLLLSDLYAVLARFKPDGLVVGDGTVVTPAGDLLPAPGATLRTSLANVALAA